MIPFYELNTTIRAMGKFLEDGCKTEHERYSIGIHSHQSALKIKRQALVN